ncbi:bifunctional diguanylate cyclase/phosphodiesterase [Lyngbya confervoides]|uniref:EAL domain-containing protein n=1 Tax=Lyngbya confervoides BDU141951 TaxID=1574623 RepID=A0ABD4SYG3_9CYAN|nr:EAL domain-containing protein [Lyngbya confervoides]MCM1981459.1 EAL domain-containing protein [Lyngbya confervoides BDU141951]
MVNPVSIEADQHYAQFLEGMVRAIGSLFESTDLHQGISRALAQICGLTQADVAYLLYLDGAVNQPTIQRWAKPSAHLSSWFHYLKRAGHPRPWVQDALKTPDSWLWHELSLGHSIVGAIPELPWELQTLIGVQTVQSILLQPLMDQGALVGVLGLEAHQDLQYWGDREVQTLSQFTTIVGESIRRSRQATLLSRNALHDTLTGLPNRALLLNRLNHCLGRMQRNSSYRFAVLFLDLDRFKPVNDSFGHQIGDLLLVQVAQRLSRLVRPGDTVARLGGDEFVILLDDIQTLEDAEAAAKRVDQDLQQVFDVNGHQLYIDVSIGIALSHPDFKTGEDLLQQSDLAMYQAKSAGKGCYRVFDREAHAQRLKASQLEAQLPLALKQDEFEVFYQPIINLKSGVVKGFEALVRWNHPQLGRLSPDQFIPIAEETGLIQALGEWVLQTACAQMSAWHGMVPGPAKPSINVNLSARQFAQPHLLKSIQNILHRSQLDPAYLNLELTESCIFNRDQETLRLVQQLQELGAYIYLDDFGVGYSSLQYLNFFPLNGLKIDRSFTQKLNCHAQTQAIVRSVISMAQALQMEIVAEGIENYQQTHCLSTLNCCFGQGFLYAPPLSGADAANLLTQQLSF